jgi:hypothetical protein
MKALIAALCAAVLLAACSGSGDDRAQTVPAPTTTAANGAPAETANSSDTAPPSEAAPADVKLTKAQIKKALLTINDMPTGYSIDSSNDDDDDTPSGCKPLDSLPDTDQYPDSAEINFTKGSFGPFVGEGITALPEGQAHKLLGELADALSKCSTFSSKNDDGTTTKATLQPLSFPKLGDETFAVRLAMDAEGFPLTLDLVVVRSGSNLLLIDNAGIGTVDSSVTESVTRKAVKKLQDA